MALRALRAYSEAGLVGHVGQQHADAALIEFLEALVHVGQGRDEVRGLRLVVKASNADILGTRIRREHGCDGV